MVAPGSKAAKKRDPRRADEWPVREYPYLVRKPYMDLKYFRCLPDANRFLRDDIIALRNQFKHLDSGVVQACDKLLEQVGQLSSAGGNVEGVVDQHTGVRYRAELILRKEV